MDSEKKLTHSIKNLAVATGFLLLIPLLAIQFTVEVAWDPGDFLVAGALVFVTGLTYKMITRKSGKSAYRFAVGLTLATALLLIWSNLAVGLIGSENNPINLLYFGVLAVGTIGATIAQFQSHGMERALYATALAQVLVTVIALGIGIQQFPGSSFFEILGVNGFFIVLWIESALLFRYAAQEEIERFLF